MQAAESAALLVKPIVACRQLEDEVPAVAAGVAPNGSDDIGATGGKSGTTAYGAASGTPSGPASPRPRRFYGTVQLDPARVGRDARGVADEVIAHLAGQVGADVTVTLEMAVSMPDGVSYQIVRTVTENSRKLKFTSYGFEAE